MMLVLFALALFVIAAFIVLKWPYRYFIQMGVKQGKPIFPFGDNIGTIMRTQSFAEMSQMAYNYGQPNDRFSGMYQFLLPTLLIRDPELIKQITVKDFDHFLNHRSLIPVENEPIFGGNLFLLTGQKWRDMRVTLSPAFTSSKMKYMFNLISDSGKQFVQHFLKHDSNELEMRDVFTRFTNDVIANIAFGVQCDSLGDRNNEFYSMGKETTDFSGFWKTLKLFGGLLSPWLYRKLHIRIFSETVSNFFIHLVKSNIESREKHGIVRPDMIHLLLEARKHGFKQEDNTNLQDTGFATVQEADLGETSVKKREITDIDITSQALIFFFAGFDAVSSLMCWMSYELGVNPDIQAKLIQEVDETYEHCKGEITYEALLGMKYLDMVLSETLRKWPNAVGSDRVCTKPYTIEPKYPHEKPIHLKPGDVLWVPTFGIHRDPKYYLDPLRFDPERFNDENKNKIQPYTYLPFGTGPRNCIGSRFALLETKVLFFYILSNFEIVPVAKTQIPARLSKKGFNFLAEGGFWFGLKKREK